MIVTYGGQPCFDVTVSEPDIGPCTVTFKTENKPPTKSTIVIAGQPQAGTLTQSTEVHGVWSSQFVAGGGGWQVEHGDECFRGPIRYATALSIIARAVGERVVVAPNADRQCEQYVFHAGKASGAIESPWFVDADGVTQVGANRGRAIPADDYRVTKADKSSGQIVGTSDVWIRTGDTVDGHVLSRVDIDESGEFTAEILGTPSLASVLRDAVASPTNDHLVAYTVAGKVLKPVADGPQIQIPSQYFFPGFTATFAPGTRLLVGYVDGDRSRPVIVGGDSPGLVKARISALTVSLGPTGEVPMAVGPSVTAALAAIVAACGAAATALAPSPLASGGLVAASFTSIATAIAPFLASINSKTIGGDL
jgi:hypothetical protein